MAKRVVVIGAGFGGLSAAAYLAKAGHHVTVVEKNDRPGGRAMVMKQKGYTFDLGPSWYLMPDVFDEVFADFGVRTSDFFKLKELSPSYKVFEVDESYDVHTAPQVFELFERLDKGSVKRVQELLQQTKDEYERVRGGLLSDPQLSVVSVLKNPNMQPLLKRFDLIGSYHNRIAAHTDSEKLQHILEFMTVFLGGSPNNIPAMYSLLTHVDLGLGVQYPLGGMGSVVMAFESLAKSLGARFKYGSAVNNITTTKDRVSGVIMEDGDFLAADYVIANADYHHVETQLLKPAARSYSASYWRKRTTSPSGLLIFLGVKKRIPKLRHHNLFFDADWDGHFKDVFTRNTWTKNPLFYVSCPSKTDPSVAPKGHENIFILAPQSNGKQPNHETIDETVETILTRLEHKTGSRLRDAIEFKDIRAQYYFTRTFNAYQGNAFGLAHTLRQTGPLRPKMKSPKVEGLYYVGQYTNPGTGVPLVVLSGKTVAGLVDNDD